MKNQRDEISDVLCIFGTVLIVIGITMGPSPDDYLDMLFVGGGLVFLFISILIGSWPQIRRQIRMERYYRRHHR